MIKCPDEQCNGELRKHPEVLLSLPPIYTYGCLKCKKNYKQNGGSDILSPHWFKSPIDWENTDKFLDNRKKRTMNERN